MEIRRSCSKCTNLYAHDEAPGDLCPICQTALDDFGRAVKATAVGLAVLGGVIATMVVAMAAGQALLKWSGLVAALQIGLLAVAAVVSLLVAYVIGEATLDEIARRRKASASK